ncbi:hypothetical protein JCM8547_009258 [Rhodosporidiobolus lusitaniae]
MYSAVARHKNANPPYQPPRPAAPPPPQPYRPQSNYQDLTDPSTFRPLPLPPSPQGGTAFSVPSPNGKGQYDRQMPPGPSYGAQQPPARYPPLLGQQPRPAAPSGSMNRSGSSGEHRGGYRGGYESGGSGQDDYGQGNRWENGGGRAYSQGGEGFNGYDAARRSADSARERALANANIYARKLATVSSSSFHGGGASSSSSNAEQRRMEEARKREEDEQHAREVAELMSDLPTVEKKVREWKSEALQEREFTKASKTTASSSPWLVSGTRGHDLYDKLRKLGERSASVSSTASSTKAKSRSASSTRSNEVEIISNNAMERKEDKGKGKEKATSDTSSKKPHKRAASRSPSPSPSGTTKKMKHRRDGFGDDDDDQAKTAAAARPPEPDRGVGSSKDLSPSPSPGFSPIRKLAALPPVPSDLELDDREDEDGDSVVAAMLTPKKTKGKGWEVQVEKTREKAKKRIVVSNSEEDPSSSSPAKESQEDEEAKKQRGLHARLQDLLVPDDEDELLKKAERIDPDTLCPFCDDELPHNPSSELVALKRYLLSRPEAKPAPTLINCKAVRLTVAQTAEFCKMHKVEREVLPHGVAQGWPETVDWEGLAKRIERECQPYLQDIIFGKQQSDYLRRAKDDYGDQGKNFRNAVAEFGSFDVEQPGYYGARGFEVLQKTLHNLFVTDVPILTSHRTSPLPVDFYIRRVLVPESAISLIQRDRSLPTRGEAEVVMKLSRAYGMAWFSMVTEEERRENARGREREMEREEREKREKKKEKEDGQPQRKSSQILHVDVNDDTDDEREATPDPSPPPLLQSKPAGRKPRALLDAQQRGASSSSSLGSRAPSSPAPVAASSPKKGKKRRREGEEEGEKERDGEASPRRKKEKKDKERSKDKEKEKEKDSRRDKRKKSRSPSITILTASTFAFGSAPSSRASKSTALTTPSLASASTSGGGGSNILERMMANANAQGSSKEKKKTKKEKEPKKEETEKKKTTPASIPLPASSDLDLISSCSSGDEILDAIIEHTSFAKQNARADKKRDRERKEKARKRRRREGKRRRGEVVPSSGSGSESE